MSPREEVENEFGHVPVLLREVLDVLDPSEGMVVVDATVGAGGHAAALLERAGGKAFLLGLDRDSSILEKARVRLAPFEGRARLFHSPFSELARVVREAGFDHADRILFDLGVSSPALDTPERGFGFMVEGPLDMRMDPSGGGPTAAELVARLSEGELYSLIREFGEDRYARRIARAIVRERRKAPISTTTRLAELVARAVPPSPHRRIHPATRTFQALRIAVNRELDQLREGLEAAKAVLGPGGRVAVISFHSLEDRMVKRFFREKMTPLFRKPIRPSTEEVRRNRRARSARLRAAGPPEAPPGEEG